MKLHTRMFIGVTLGVVVGGVARLPGAHVLTRAVIAIEPIGTVFIRLITMTVVPLVVASLFVGVASLGDVRRLGRIGSRTLAYFLATTLLAATMGLLLARIVRPGEGIDRAALLAGPNVQAAAQTAGDIATTKMPSLVSTLVAMVPQNAFASAAQGDLLPLIVAVCMFAAAATMLTSDSARAVTTFFTGVNELAMVVINWLMHLAPFAVFALLAATVARTGADLLGSLLAFSAVVVGALLLHTGTTLAIALRVGARLGIVPFVRAIGDAALLAFSTASSSAALPVSMAAARDKLGVSAGMASFVLPAGSSLNKNGAAAYKAVTAVYIAQLYGLSFSTGLMLTVVLVSTVAAFAGAGVPGSSLVTTLIVLNAVGLGSHAAEGIALVVAIDRPLDMCRSAVNTIGNLVGVAVIARSEGEALVGAT